MNQFFHRWDVNEFIDVTLKTTIRIEIYKNILILINTRVLAFHLFNKQVKYLLSAQNVGPANCFIDPS